jgi:hypothetical protein
MLHSGAQIGILLDVLLEPLNCVPQCVSQRLDLYDHSPVVNVLLQ